jgi:hypothetical protein
MRKVYYLVDIETGRYFTGYCEQYWSKDITDAEKFFSIEHIELQLTTYYKNPDDEKLRGVNQIEVKIVFEKP